MATVLNEQIQERVPQRRPSTDPDAWNMLVRILKPIASLRLTVALFLAAIFVVLIGTLAQVNDEIWQVVRDYFRVDFRRALVLGFPWLNGRELFFWVDPTLFFPPAFAPEGPPAFPKWLGFWFPKGWIVGTLMMANLFSAHLIRFKIQASGKRLWLGTGVIVLGALITFFVIQSGSNTEGLQAKPMIDYTTLWWLMQISVFGLSLLSLYMAITSGAERKELRWLFGTLAVVLGISSVIAFQTEASNESTMRILYQVMQATFAGVVLLAGCIAVFKKRAGIVLLHAGIGLMMCYDVLVGMKHVESQMQIMEGETVNFSRDMRDAEFAVSQPLKGNQEQVTVLDAFRLSTPGATITDKRLPFTIQVLEYYPNSTILGPRQSLPKGVPETNPTTARLGL